MKKNEALPGGPWVTPTTKSAEHDEPISGAAVVSLGLMSAGDWALVSARALAVFAAGAAAARERGLILVDTKYEFGKTADGQILLIDEIQTPDSSRFWVAESYQQRLAASPPQEPENIDKEFLRRWYADRCDPYKDAVLPEAPRELVCELSRRYIMIYEIMTGGSFAFADSSADSMNAALEEYLQKKQQS